MSFIFLAGRCIFLTTGTFYALMQRFLTFFSATQCLKNTICSNGSDPYTVKHINMQIQKEFFFFHQLFKSEATFLHILITNRVFLAINFLKEILSLKVKSRNQVIDLIFFFFGGDVKRNFFLFILVTKQISTPFLETGILKKYVFPSLVTKLC